MTDNILPFKPKPRPVPARSARGADRVIPILFDGIGSLAVIDDIKHVCYEITAPWRVPDPRPVRIRPHLTVVPGGKTTETAPASDDAIPESTK